MEDNKVFLNRIHVENFLSLHDVELPLKPLTILVGPNASGKSNVLRALRLINRMMVVENLPPVEYIQNVLWAGVADLIRFELQINVDDKEANYRLELKPESENQISSEELIVSGIKVISVSHGKGEVKDEDNRNPITYRSKKLALNSAGDYGYKPITSALTEFIRGWEFYDFKPHLMRRESIVLHSPPDVPAALDNDGVLLQDLLSYWYTNDFNRFQAVNDALKACSRLGIEYHDNGEADLYLLEGYKNPIPLERASDGTVRLLAYHTLLNQPELPSLIAIEEPERNLHPGALSEIRRVLEQLAEETQVIITTHSSQLLDSFNADSLSDNLGVLLLRNRPGSGTVVTNLEKERNNREALSDWIEDFGIGSAIFHSELLQDIMEG
jgi:predicted ATPase